MRSDENFGSRASLGFRASDFLPSAATMRRHDSLRPFLLADWGDASLIAEQLSYETLSTMQHDPRCVCYGLFGQGRGARDLSSQ